MRHLKNIIWDWNGTLLNDVDICIESINKLLLDRNLPQLEHNRYINVFDFPVKDYYQRIGFDFKKEPFETPANQFIDLYFTKLKNARLHSKAHEVLQFFKNKNYCQFILSAAEEVKLKEALNHFGIAHFFDDVTGLDHDYAHSKLELGKEMLVRNSINPSETYIIGDTLHDYSVANELKCNCILIANGHQPYNKLKTTGTKVFNKLEEMISDF